MEPSEQQEQLWESLGLESQATGEQVKLPNLTNVSQRTTTFDRIARLLTTATIPLFVVSLCTLAVVGFGGHTVVIVLAPLLALLFSWLLAPLASSIRGPVAWRIVFLCLPIIGYACLSLTLPLQLGRSYSDSHLYPDGPFSFDLQIALETIFKAPATSQVLLFILLATILSQFTRLKSPWLDPPTRKPWRVLMGVLLVISPLMFSAYLYYGVRMTSDATAWVSSVAKESSSRPLFALPIKGEDTLWKGLREKWRDARLEPHGGQGAVLLKGQKILVPQFLKACQTREPNNREEMEFSMYALSKIIKSEQNGLTLQQNAELTLHALRYALVTRDSYHVVPTERTISKRLMPFLLNPELEEQELREMERVLGRARNALAKNSDDELDSNAYDYFFKSGDFFTKTILLSSGGYRTQRHRAARPLEFFGRKIDPSPTEIAGRSRLSKAMNEWLELRKILLPLSDQERLIYLRSLLDQKGARTQFESLDHRFLENLEGRAYYAQIHPWFESLELIIKLRHHKFKTGHYPESLETLAGSPQSDRWVWSQTEQGWQLTDTAIKQYTKGQPDFRWLLP